MTSDDASSRTSSSSDSAVSASARFRRLSREGFWIVLGQAMAAAGSLAGVRLLTGLLDPAAYGELALGMTAATLVNQALFGPLGSGITRFYAPASEQGNLSGYLRAVRRLVLAATGIMAVASLLMMAGLFVAGRSFWMVMATAAFLFALLSGYNAILNGIQNAARQRAIVALHQGVEPWGRLSVAAGLILWWGATSTVAMTGYAVAVMAVLGSQYLFFRKITSQCPSGSGQDKDWQEPIWTFSWPIAVFGLFTAVQLASDRWALEVFATTETVGLYAVLLQLGFYPMSLVHGMVMQFLAPIFYQRAGDATNAERNADVSRLSWRLTRLTLALTGGVFLGALLCHEALFRIFVAARYASVSHLLPWMLLAGGIFAAGQTLALNLMSQMKTLTMAVAKIITALLGVLLNMAGAYWYGTTGIVMAGVLFSLSYFLWMAALSKSKDQGIPSCL